MLDESKVQNSLDDCLIYSGYELLKYQSRFHSLTSYPNISTFQDERIRRKQLTSYKKLFEHSRDIILFIDTKGNILDANATALKAYGYTLEEIYAKKIHDLRADNSNDLVYKQIQAAYKKGIMFETFHVRKNGDVFPVEVNSYQVSIESSKMLISNIHDITERKQREKEFVQTEVIKTIGRVAANLAHEIRNSITSVYGFLQLAASQTIDQSAFARNCDLMLGELDHANSVICGLLLVANDKDINLQPRKLNQIIRSMLPLLQSLAESQSKIVEFSLEDTHTIYLDAIEIKLLVTQLLNNALESMSPGGKVILRTQMIDNRIILSIIDNGSGIPSEIQDKLGIPFFTTKDTGVGLGLVICKRIAIRHNARMSIESSKVSTTVNIIFYTNQDCTGAPTNKRFEREVTDQ